MTKLIPFCAVPLAALLLASAGVGQTPASSPIRLLLSEVQPGSFSADQYCTLVFANHHFHSEKAARHHGKDLERKIYEGELSESEWTALNAVLDSKDLRELKIPPTVPALIVLDAHPYTISVAREGTFQNMEFIDGKSMKPYEAQIKPLLQWWKSLRAQRLPLSNAPANDRCSLDSTHALYGQ